MATIGTPFNDNNTFNNGQFRPMLTGTNGTDFMYGKEGNDILLGFGGDDNLDGGTGIDTMDGSTGSDHYHVDNVADKVIENFNEGYDTVFSSAPTYTLTANVEQLQLGGNAVIGIGNDLNNTIFGNDANNQLAGAGGNDFVAGFAGNDTIYGNAGDDDLHGDKGNDQLLGGANKDYLDGFGSGQEFDTLTGGTEADTFALGNYYEGYYLGNGYATITDFNAIEGDRIQVHGNPGDYTFGAFGADTAIYSNGDLIGVLENVAPNDFSSAFLISAPFYPIPG